MWVIAIVHASQTLHSDKDNKGHPETLLNHDRIGKWSAGHLKVLPLFISCYA